MPPPAAAPVSGSPPPNILPSNINAVTSGAPIAPASPSPRLPVNSSSSHPPTDGASLTTGPGPTRHPRPLTAAELHQELEKEQEAVVNRLTRELDLLRQSHNASVASNTSSNSANASASGQEIIPDGRQHLLSGTGFSIPSSSGRRHNRSGSSASGRSIAATAGSASVASGITAPAPIRPGGAPLSRQSSHGSSWTSSHMADAAHSGYFPLRSPPNVSGMSSSIPSATPTPGPGDPMSPSLIPATARYEETAFHRQELEHMKRENDALKRRIRELERMVRERRASDASNRPRSESASTTASVNAAATGASIVRPRNDRVTSMLSTAGSTTSSFAAGVPEDEVNVGESAASGGVPAKQ